MIDVNNYLILQRIRSKLVLESVLLTFLSAGYYSAFDGSSKPLWTNILLVTGIITYLLSNFLNYHALRNFNQLSPFTGSLKRLSNRMKLLMTLSLLTTFILAMSILGFVVHTTMLTTSRVILTTGMFAGLITSTFLTVEAWSERIGHIDEIARHIENASS